MGSRPSRVHLGVVGRAAVSGHQGDEPTRRFLHVASQVEAEVPVGPAHLDGAVVRLELRQLLIERAERLAKPGEYVLHGELGEPLHGLALGQLPIDLVRAEADRPALPPEGDIIAHDDS